MKNSNHHPLNHYHDSPAHTNHATERLSRRSWLGLTASTLGYMSIPSLQAGEGSGKWNDKSIAEYSLKLMNWLKSNFEDRAKQLKAQAGILFTPEYDYLAPTTDRRKLRMLEKFEEGRLSGRAAEKHITQSLAEYERVRLDLAKVEQKAAQTWRSDSDSIEVKNGRVYDTSISASRLTVILDKSRSMTPYLEKLRKEIARDFSNAHIVEVDGCHLNRKDSCPWFYAAPVSGVNPFTPDRHIPRVPAGNQRPYSTFIRWTRALPSAIDAMTDLMHADAIYWFCDFDDKHDDEVIKRLARKIITKKIRLYVHTVNRRPPSLISLLAKESGGAVIKKRI